MLSRTRDYCKRFHRSGADGCCKYLGNRVRWPVTRQGKSRSKCRLLRYYRNIVEIQDVGSSLNDHQSLAENAAYKNATFIKIDYTPS